MISFTYLQAAGKKMVTEHASAILTAGGVVGTVTTAILSGRAAVKAHEIIREEELMRIHADGTTDTLANGTMGLSKQEKILMVWPVFVPPVLIGTLTIGSIVTANLMTAKRAAALAAAYGVSERQLKEYKEKVAEKLTGPKSKEIKDEIKQDRVTDNPPTREVIILAGGDMLCYDMLTGRYFRSTPEQIRQAANKINAELANHQYASLSQFYDEVGLPATNYTETVGWSMINQDVAFEVELSTVTAPDGQPCLAIDFNVQPTPDYSRLY